MRILFCYYYIIGGGSSHSHTAQDVWVIMVTVLGDKRKKVRGCVSAKNFKAGKYWFFFLI